MFLLPSKRLGLDLLVRKIPWRRKWQPTPVFCLANAMDRGVKIHGVIKESDMTELDNKNTGVNTYTVANSRLSM